MSKIELYKYTNANVRYWSIEPRYNDCVLVIRHGVLDGVIQEDYEDVDINQSGRDIEDQMDLRVNARIKSKMDIGYRYTVEESRGARD